MVQRGLHSAKGRGGRLRRAGFKRIGIVIGFVLLLSVALFMAASYEPGAQMPGERGTESSQSLISKAVGEETEDPKPITDVRKSDWFYPAYVFCEEQGGFEGIPFDGLFSADKPISRGMFAAMLYNVFGPEDGETSEGIFSDVESDDYFSAAVSWIAEGKIIEGLADDGLFHPYDALSREEMMSMIARLAESLGYEITLGSNRTFLVYADREEVSEWAREDVMWCLQEQLVTGTTDETISPQTNLTRGQAVQVILNMARWMENGSPVREIPSSQDVETLSPEAHEQFQTEIDAIAKKYGAVGLSVAYVENGRVADTFAYGYAIRNDVPMTADTKIRVASLSKVLVGLATMFSVENGIMSLDESIGTYWGFELGTRAAGDVVTARSILTHTSSLVSTDSVSATYYDAMAKRLRTGSGINSIVSGKIGNWSYNNYAVDVLGATVELANDRELDDILEEYVYEPLEMDAAFYGGDLDSPDQIATIYRSDGSIGRSAAVSAGMESDGVPGSCSSSFAGGLVTSAYDMGKLTAALANDGVYDGTRVFPSSVVENLEYHEGNKVDPFWQGQPLRYRTDAYSQEAIYYHTGSAYGVYNLMCYNPVTGCGVVVLTSGASGVKDANGIYAVCGAVADLLLNQYGE